MGPLFVISFLRRFTRVATVFVTAWVFLAAASAETPTRPGEIALKDPAARDAGGPGHELSSAAAQIGVDYPVLLQQARRGDLRAIALFVLLADLVDLDGATAESYCSDQTDLLEAVGDRTFAKALAPLSPAALATCYRYLCFGITQEPPDSAAAMRAVKERAPKTIAAIAAAHSGKPLWK